MTHSSSVVPCKILCVLSRSNAQHDIFLQSCTFPHPVCFIRSIVQRNIFLQSSTQPHSVCSVSEEVIKRYIDFFRVVHYSHPLYMCLRVCQENLCLKRLNLSRNGLGNKGCEAAVEALVNNRTLLELDLSGNRIMNDGFLALARSLSRNEALQILKVSSVRRERIKTRRRLRSTFFFSIIG